MLGFAAGVALPAAFLTSAPPRRSQACWWRALVIAMIDAPRLLARAQGRRRHRHIAPSPTPLTARRWRWRSRSTSACRRSRASFLRTKPAPPSSARYAAAFGLARPLDIIFMGSGAALSPLLLPAYEDERRRQAARDARASLRVARGARRAGSVGLALVAQPLAALMVGEGLRASAAARAAMARAWLALAVGL